MDCDSQPTYGIDINMNIPKHGEAPLTETGEATKGTFSGVKSPAIIGETATHGIFQRSREKGK
jgi:hypothetical protein